MTTRKVHAWEAHDAPEAIEDAYRIQIKKTWKRLRAEPWYFWLFCGYILFEYVRPQVIYPALDFLPWGLVTLMGAFFLRLTANEPKPLASPVTLPFLLFFIWAAITAVFSYYPQVALKRYDILINWPLVLVLFLWIVNTRFRFFIVLLLFLLCTFKMAQHSGLGWVRRGFSFSSWGAAGAGGFFQNAADLGVQLLIFIPLSTAFYLGFKRYFTRFWRLFFLAFPVLAIAGAISTGQRNTMVGMAALGIGVILLFRHRVRNLLFVAIAATAIWLAMPPEFKARFDTAGEDGTSLTRLHYWKRGIEIWENHPLMGIGYNNWLPYYATYYPGETVGWKKAEVAHSVPVSLLAELGTIGFLLYYWLVVKVFFTNLRSARMLAQADPPFWRMLPIALNLGLMAILATGLFLSNQYYPTLFFQAAFTAAVYRLALKEQRVNMAAPVLGGPRRPAPEHGRLARTS